MKKTCGCGGEMQVGFISDYGPMASVLTATFVQGTPEAREGRWE